MKKIMIALAAVAMAVCANAAVVSWNSGALYNPLADGSWSTVKATSDVGTWLATVTFYADNEGAMGAKIAPGGTLTDNSVSALNALNANAGTGTSGFEFNTDYWAVLELSFTGESGMAQTLTSKAVTFKTKGSGTTTLNFQSQGGFSSADKYTAVPEPTSGLLLLLGIAGMALRRRRA